MRSFTHRPAVFLAFTFTGGIYAGNILGPGFLIFTIAWALLAGILASWYFRRGTQALLVGFVFLFGFFAAWNTRLLPTDHVSFGLDAWYGRDVDVVGRVVSVPEKRTKGLAPKEVFVCELERVDHQPLRGRVLVNLFAEGGLHYGDRFETAGKLSRPFELSSGKRSSYCAHLARQGIYAVLHVRRVAPLRVTEKGCGVSFEAAALSVRVRLQQVFDLYLSPGEAGLMNAMLLGPRDDIPAHVYDVFRRTGTAHIIAISGMNMTLTAFGVVFFLGIMRVPRVPRAVLAVLIIGFYSFMAGNSAPVARSALMAVVVILSFIVERETDVFNSLGFAALVLFAVDPGQLMDAGCQLSFACVASLVLLGPIILAPFEELGWREHRVLWFLIESAGVTLAAFIGSAGILAYYFGYLASIGLIVNLPVIPLMALVTALGAALLVSGLVLPVAAVPFALCLKVVLNAAVALLAWAAQVPHISCENIAAGVVIFYYAALCAGVMFFYHFRSGSAAPFIDKPIPL